MVVVELGGGNRHRLVGITGEDGKGAGRIEGEAANVIGINILLVQDTLDGSADALPNVVRRLFLSGRNRQQACPPSGACFSARTPT